MKKYISIWIILLMTLFIFVGCTSNKNDNLDSAKYSYDEAKTILLNDTSAEVAKGISFENNTITISKSGAYSISGNSNGINILVDCDDEVDLYLNGINMYNESKPCIYSKNSSKTFIIPMNNTENNLQDSSNGYETDEGEKLDAVIFSCSDLYFDGSGKINITANYKHAICGKDSIYLSNIDLESSSIKKGISSNDEIIINSGNYNIASVEGDCIHADDADKGNIIINDGTINIDAADDGIHAENSFIINDGKINILNSKEGIEAHTIDINGGDIILIANDDGINAADFSNNTEETFNPDKRNNDSFNPENNMNQPPDKPEEVPNNTNGQPPEPLNNSNNQQPPMNDNINPIFDVDESCYVHITGGNLDINANGDGIDSNGEIKITGGTIIAFGSNTGGNSVLDYGTKAIINKGNVLLYGSSGMIEPFTEGNSNSIIIYLTNRINTEDTISVNNTSGEELISTKAKNSADCIIIGGDKFSKGEYILKINNEEFNFTINKGHTSINIEK